MSETGGQLSLIIIGKARKERCGLRRKVPMGESAQASHSRDEIVPVYQVFWYILDGILEEEIIRMAVYAFMPSFGEPDVIAPMTKFDLLIRELVQPLPVVISYIQQTECSPPVRSTLTITSRH
jgi:hypothetical protein